MPKPDGFLVFALAAITVGCQSPAERARIEMQSVYRSAKTLNEQMKAGTDLKELVRLQGNFATELGIVRDHMEGSSRLDRILGPYYAAYQTTLQSYALVLDTLEYHETFERCAAPRHDPADADHRKYMSLDELTADVEATGEFFGRVFKCVKQYSSAEDSLRERAGRLGMNCPKLDMDDSGCLAAFAETRLTNAEKLLVGR
jgi:hypothetical protein